MRLNLLLVAVTAGTIGWYAARLGWSLPTLKTPEQPSHEPVQCPMHPWIKSKSPAQCTMCGMDLVASQDVTQDSKSSKEEPILLPPGSPHVIGVQTAEVKMTPLVRTLRVAGTIQEDESRHRVISANVDGRIDGLAMSCEGELITQRQPLGTIFSRTLLAAAEEYKRALPQGGSALEEITTRLTRYGLVAEQINAIAQRQPDNIHFSIVAPLTGSIVKSYVNEGQYVKAGDKLFEIADFSKMWFQFIAYEQDLPFIQPGQWVEVSTPALPGKTMKARIKFIIPLLDDSSRSARVRVVLENPDRQLKSGLYAEGLVRIETPEALTVPRSAVLWPGGSPGVFVEKATGTYEHRIVKLGRAGDSDWEVLDGLAAGEKVVTSGNMLLDSQARLVRQ